jgi:hypothetical protein
LVYWVYSGKRSKVKGKRRKAFEWGSGNAEGGKGRMGKDAPSAIKNT